MSEIVIFEDDVRSVEVRLEGETLWATQRQMAELFDTSTDNIGLHLKNVYAEAELDEATTTEDFSVVRHEGNRQVQRRLKHYNLDAVISVGYRVSSRRATRFRQWATRVLRMSAAQAPALFVREQARSYRFFLGLLAVLTVFDGSHGGSSTQGRGEP